MNSYNKQAIDIVSILTLKKPRQKWKNFSQSYWFWQNQRKNMCGNSMTRSIFQNCCSKIKRWSIESNFILWLCGRQGVVECFSAQRITRQYNNMSFSAALKDLNDWQDNLRDSRSKTGCGSPPLGTLSPYCCQLLNTHCREKWCAWQTSRWSSHRCTARWRTHSASRSSRGRGPSGQDSYPPA